MLAQHSDDEQKYHELAKELCWYKYSIITFVIQKETLDDDVIGSIYRSGPLIVEVSANCTRTHESHVRDRIQMKSNSSISNRILIQSMLT